MNVIGRQTTDGRTGDSI